MTRDVAGCKGPGFNPQHRKGKKGGRKERKKEERKKRKGKENFTEEPKRRKMSCPYIDLILGRPQLFPSAPI